ncbi:MULTISPECIES: ribosome recycling factor [Deinococcus]|jgi:ribosome recycling factor|uniref:Ribosome-recycling factor n=2 Tax=Deinococcus soli (ex Cha et al. 2016) TaxID=1309411 RepID=A0A0F7JK79_9DEIO|nr:MULTISPECIES: ribosome recycling factor [Deinococcus]AKH16092.1 ribosome recycling factor [Deinococcus soli (ex Cha et al. 2016)]MDK2011697.1 ribosome recycling factor [Deinococcus sp. 43]MDR6216479.1 ribosome recycling factor [Deinococcus soli (ex Cha et al. 2016)]MDR6327300.1 ribosome recycling factor [Deinococcus soli (ex Cha et al. 2016)]MDR6749575.1 ribosome recycling factor [Deinococcus soli (ex Cha et al. 2016)]
MADMKTIQADTREKMGKAIESLENNLSVLRTGRANPGILKKIVVDYYGSTMPIDQVASITTPDARTLVITPWDRGALNPIEKAIRDSDLGLNPNNKGDTIFISLPMLTEERRKDLVKNAKSYSEDARIAVRNIRKHALDEVKKVEGIGDDEIKRGEADVQKITDEFIAKVDQTFQKKEQEILG